MKWIGRATQESGKEGDTMYKKEPNIVTAYIYKLFTIVSLYTAVGVFTTLKLLGYYD